MDLRGVQQTTKKYVVGPIQEKEQQIGIGKALARDTIHNHSLKIKTPKLKTPFMLQISTSPPKFVYLSHPCFLLSFFSITNISYSVALYFLLNSFTATPIFR